MEHKCECDLVAIEVAIGAALSCMSHRAIIYARDLIDCVLAGNFNVQGLAEVAMPTRVYLAKVEVDLRWSGGHGLFFAFRIDGAKLPVLTECVEHTLSGVSSSFESVFDDTAAVVRVGKQGRWPLRVTDCLKWLQADLAAALAELRKAKADEASQTVACGTPLPSSSRANCMWSAGRNWRS